MSRMLLVVVVVERFNSEKRVCFVAYFGDENFNQNGKRRMCGDSAYRSGYNISSFVWREPAFKPHGRGERNVPAKRFRLRRAYDICPDDDVKVFEATRRLWEGNSPWCCAQGEGSQIADVRKW